QGSWQGSPLDFDLSKMDLAFDLALDNGYFAAVSSSTSSTLKLMSILILCTIIRRLKLDFSDLTQKGLSFDRVRGQFVLQQGLIKTQSPLTVKSASSNIRIDGKADFNSDLLDLNMAVSLPLASNIPWLVALAAGLPAAAGVLVIG